MEAADPSYGKTAWLCRLANVAGLFWDFVDKRNIDQHAMAWMVAWCGWDLTRWGMAFAEQHPEMSGAEMAMVLASVGAPYAIFAGAVVSWYFKRQDE